MQIDPRRLTALLLEVDALAQEVQPWNIEELNAALDRTSQALEQAEAILAGKALFFQVPSDYKPPTRPIKKPGNKEIWAA